MKASKLILFIILSLVLTIPAWAGRFSDMGGYGVSTVGGTGADYATLYSAATDFSWSSQPVTGDWTLYINGNLTEPENSAFGKNLNGYKLILKPLTSCTVTFQKATDNVGPSGHLVFGVPSTSSWFPSVDMPGIEINGAVSGSTRNLTLTDTFASLAGARLISIVNNCDTAVIKNMNLLLKSTNGSSIYGVMFGARTSQAPSFTFNAPDYGTIENCYIEATAGTAAQCVYIYNSLAAAGQAIQGTTIKNNTLFARARGIFLNPANNVNIENNIFRVWQLNPGNYQFGVYHYGTNSETGWTMNIKNNTFDYITTNTNSAAYGPCYLDISLAGGTYNIINNYFQKIQFSVTTANVADIKYQGIRASSNDANYNIYYNSFYMPTIANYTNTVANTYAMLIGSATYAGTANIKNNIIEFGQPKAAAIVIQNAAATVNLDYNNIYTYGGASTLKLGSTYYATMTDLTTAINQNRQGQAVSMTQGGILPVKWSVWRGGYPDVKNLKTSLEDGIKNPEFLIAGTPISGVTTDIYGNLRSDTKPYIGCSEYTTAAIDSFSLSGLSNAQTTNISSVGTTLFKLVTNDGTNTYYTPVRLEVYGITGSEDITITAYDGKHPNREGDFVLSRWFKIDRTGSAINDAELVLSYTDDDLTDSGVSDADLHVARYESGSWFYGGTAADGDNPWIALSSHDWQGNRMKVKSVKSFSDWTLSGQTGLVPVELSGFDAE